MRGIVATTLNGVLLIALNVLLPVHMLNIGFPVGSRSRLHISQQRGGWHMSSRNAENTATSASKGQRPIVVEFVQETPGGFITTLKATSLKGAATRHRVVVGKDQVRSFSESAEREVAVEELVTYTIQYMMDKGMPLDNTEGMIDASVFPVNYFTLRQLTYFHDDVDEKITALCKEAPDLSE